MFMNIEIVNIRMWPTPGRERHSQGVGVDTWNIQNPSPIGHSVRSTLHDGRVQTPKVNSAADLFKARPPNQLSGVLSFLAQQLLSFLFQDVPD